MTRGTVSRVVHKSDPAEYGWIRTGENGQSCVVFWQRDDVKIDYYPTTGTVKTSFKDPRQGKIQEFRQMLFEAEFISVLENPHTKTGKEYQTKKGRKEMLNKQRCHAALEDIFVHLNIN